MGYACGHHRRFQRRWGGSRRFLSTGDVGRAADAIQYAAGPDVFVTTARNNIGTTWDAPVQIANGATTTAWSGGLLVNEGQYAAALQIYRPVGSTASQLTFIRRDPPPYSISWIAVQP